jgi:hypothetical protein
MDELDSAVALRLVGFAGRPGGGAVFAKLLTTML